MGRPIALAVDESELFLVGLAQCLNDIGCTVSQYSELDSAIAQINTGKPDVLVIGPHNPEIEVFACLHGLLSHNSNLPILLFHPEATDPLVLADASVAGASACLPHTSSCQRCQLTIKLVLSGAMIVPREGLETLVQPVTPTRQEQRVLEMLDSDVSYAEIAANLGLQYNTVRNIAQRLLEKFSVHTRPEVVRRALRRGLIGI